MRGPRREVPEQPRGDLVEGAADLAVACLARVGEPDACLFAGQDPPATRRLSTRRSPPGPPNRRSSWRRHSCSSQPVRHSPRPVTPPRRARTGCALLQVPRPPESAEARASARRDCRTAGRHHRSRQEPLRSAISSSRPAARYCWTTSAPPPSETSFTPAAALACSSAGPMPSVTKWNVVPPAISSGVRGWRVRTKTGW